ncbi:hypothetical protein [Idiomarina sp.]|uniref:hypothetical protein n=1 Tax=Idiomarina sp. TaxID=1874361 RepID=UPI003517345E
MTPDFSKNTINILAKRAGYLCSNPDCRISTVGPNEDPTKAIVIGEAAHIYGARPSAKRFSSKMTDVARAEITNAIWLCRNCHKTIDADELKYTVDILFRWRELHENYVAESLGTTTEKIIKSELNEKLLPFARYSDLVKRIVSDQPPAWEWRLGAELIKELTHDGLKRLKQLDKGLYAKPVEFISLDYVHSWASLKNAELINIAHALNGVLSELTASFGEAGVKGELTAIHDSCLLIQSLVENAIEFEESVKFVSTPFEAEKLIELYRGLVTPNIIKLAEIPDSLNEVVAMALDEERNKRQTITITKTLVFDLPKNWQKNVVKELRRIDRSL